MSHMSSRLSSSYTSVFTVRTVEARSAAIVPNLTGFSVRRLRDPPHLGELERHARADLVDDGVVLPAADDLVEPGTDGIRPAGRRLRVELGDAAQTLARVGEPGATGEVEVEVVVTVRDDVQARRAPGR